MKRNTAILLALLLLIGLPPVGVGYFNAFQAENLRQFLPAQASTHYETAARLLFWERDLREKAGLAAFEAGDFERADALLSEARERGTLSPEGLFTLGEIYHQRGDPEAAYAEAWLPLYQSGFRSGALSARLAEYKEARQDFPGAVTYLIQLTLQEPENAPAHYRLGVLLAAKDPQKALSSLDKARALDASLQPRSEILHAALETALAQDNPAYRYIITGRALANLDEWQLALEAFRAATEADPNYAEAWAWQAEARYQLGEPTETVLSDYDQALALNPASAGIQVMTGLFWERQGKFSQAEAHYQRAVELEPQNPAWQLALAGSIARRDLPAALQQYLAVTRLAPDEVETWLALATFSVEHEAYLQDYGLEAALRAYALEPANPQVLDLLGRALAASGELETARIIYEKAITAAPEQAAPHFHLALLLMQTNQRAEARAALKETVRLDPAGPYGAQAQNILDRYFP